MSATLAWEDVEHALEHGVHLLPSQGPIAIFVHHNTLHAFEDYPFEEAVQKGFNVYGAQPYFQESRYRHEVERGRISADDVKWVLDEDLGTAAHEPILGSTTRGELRLTMMSYPLRSGPDQELKWTIAETDALRHFRSDVSPTIANGMVEGVRRWMMRDYTSPQTVSNDQLAKVLMELFEDFDPSTREHWNEETWRRFTLDLLYRVCLDGAKQVGEVTKQAESCHRHNEIVHRALELDGDEPVHELLIRFLGSFFDQGFAQWTVPGRDLGLYRCFLQLYGDTSQPRLRLRELVKQEGHLQKTPRESILTSLAALGIDSESVEPFVEQTLLALPGWTGMVWQLETNAEWTPWPASAGTLEEFLAVRLLLDRASLEYIVETKLTKAQQSLLGAKRDLETLAKGMAFSQRRKTCQTVEQRAYLFFQIAQLMDWQPIPLSGMDGDSWQKLLDEVSLFGSMARRRIFHLAYERHYRNQVLDAISQQPTVAERKDIPSPPLFQVVTCIDDREESFRRHLEEIEPKVETFGAAGFFSVPMYFRSASDAHYIPLCPVVIKPQHFVDEIGQITQKELQRRRTEARRVLGKASHTIHIGSRSLLAGSLTALAGSVASLPMVARVLAPRLTSRAKEFVGGLVRPTRATTLCLERLPPEMESDIEPDATTESTSQKVELHQGFELGEMANMVARLLGDMGLKTFSRLVIIMGHGSSSLNNPHESAYNCGACGGGRGGPNARAFAHMANDLRVRQILRERGIVIPDTCMFVGAYHNTCNDTIDYYDVDRLPPSHQKDFLNARDKLDQARRRNALERSRRFELAPLDLNPDEALKHVESRSEDLAQARPEYNHATNAVCFVGRRWRTRGLFMDRRSFLTSYDPTQDTETNDVLNRILQAVIPVCAGISLEYFFSTVDNGIYGCGSKLPHNITSLLGVMEGSVSDLRCGLSQQMVEIHEPMRILFVIENTPEAFLSIMARNPNIDRFVRNEWVQVAVLAPDSKKLQLWHRGRFCPYEPSSQVLSEVGSSHAWYRGWRDHLGFAKIQSTIPSAVSTSREKEMQEIDTSVRRAPGSE